MDGRGSGTRWLVVRGVCASALCGVGEVGRGWWPGRLGGARPPLRGCERWRQHGGWWRLVSGAFGWREATPTGDGRGAAQGGWWCAGCAPVGLGVDIGGWAWLVVGAFGWHEAPPTGDGRGLAHGGWWCAGVRVGLGWTSRVGRGWWPGRVGWREATPTGDGRGLAGGREVHAPERSTPRWDGGQRRGRGGRYPPWRRRRGRRPPGTGRPRRSAPALPAARRCPA